MWAFIFSSAPTALLFEGGVFLTLAVAVHVLRKVRKSPSE